MEDLTKLSKLTTKRLLAYYKAERERFDKNANNVAGLDMSLWHSHLGDVKSLLNEREHVEKKK